MFRVGDKVRCIDDSDSSELEVGKIYTVVEVRFNHNKYYYIVLQGIGNGGWNISRFEPVEPQKKEPMSSDTPTVMRYREGDIVHIRARVNHGGVAQIMRSDHSNGHFTINLQEFPPVHVEERPLAVGDTVIWGENKTTTYTIISIHEKWAWARNTNLEESPFSIRTEYLKRID